MNRSLRNLALFGLVLVFAAGILCSNLATPGQSLASVIDCSQKSGAMAGCEYPHDLCGSNSSSQNLQAFSSPRPNDLIKKALSQVTGWAPFAPSQDVALLGRASTSATEPHKASLRLLNSVWNL